MTGRLTRAKAALVIGNDKYEHISDPRAGSGERHAVEAAFSASAST